MRHWGLASYVIAITVMVIKLFVVTLRSMDYGARTIKARRSVLSGLR